MTDILTTIASFATAIGVVFAAVQLWLVHRQSVTTFEDALGREYRELAAKLPTKALLGEEVTEEEYRESFDEFYRYFDLSNEQAFLRQRKRISKPTWTFWLDGIGSNLRRPAFRRAWSEVCSRPGAEFFELRALFPPDARDNSGGK